LSEGSPRSAGTGLRVAVQSVDRGDEYAVHGLEIAALPIGGVVGQVRVGVSRRFSSAAA
jgi:hypothetical protein